jgi:1D-myo-inositol-tetrakisphosphate 5-kinase/inositol-polyphosphate multikinase
MDAKLGTVLYEPDAKPEKKKRMKKQAKETTIGSTGLRLTGCQVSRVQHVLYSADRKTWHASSQSFMLTPKSFGKSITVEQMPTGMIRFFPSPKDTIPSLETPSTPAAASTDKTPVPPIEGQVEATTSATGELQTYSNYTIPAKTMLRVLALIDKQLADLEAVLKTLEMRFVGSSVLIVYEGDLARLEDALDQWEARLHQVDPLKPEVDLEDEDDNDMIESESESGSDESDDLDGTKEDAKMAKKCPPVVVKMIDFAHTWIAEGQGVDEGVLKGLATLRSLVQGRKKELETVN